MDVVDVLVSDLLVHLVDLGLELAELSCEADDDDCEDCYYEC